jgi:hypothetical protein
LLRRLAARVAKKVQRTGRAADDLVEGLAIAAFKLQGSNSAKHLFCD